MTPADELLHDLDGIVTDCDMHEYGLPIFAPVYGDKMRAAVIASLVAAESRGRAAGPGWQDDAELVTAEWIKPLDGICYESAGGIQLSLRPVYLHGVWQFATIPVALPTRGHVRRLLKALGIAVPAEEQRP